MFVLSFHFTISSLRSNNHSFFVKKRKSIMTFTSQWRTAHVTAAAPLPLEFRWWRPVIIMDSHMQPQQPPARNTGTTQTHTKQNTRVCHDSLCYIETWLSVSCYWRPKVCVDIRYKLLFVYLLMFVVCFAWHASVKCCVVKMHAAVNASVFYLCI